MGVIDFWRTWSPLVCLGITTMVPSPAYPPDDVTTWDTSDLQQMSRLSHTSRGLLTWCNKFALLVLIFTNNAFKQTFTIDVFQPVQTARTMLQVMRFIPVSSGVPYANLLQQKTGNGISKHRQCRTDFPPYICTSARRSRQFITLWLYTTASGAPLKWLLCA